MAVKNRDELTPREQTVCDAICRGLTNKQAAIELGISPRTVEVHRAEVMRKYRVRNAVELVLAVTTRKEATQ
jgi:DNA-binding NarL/FixJ family response regulator